MLAVGQDPDGACGERQASRAVPLFLKRGNPTGRPVRRPFRERLQFFSARASPSSPKEYASLEFSAHQGATSCLARFHSRRSAGSVHGTWTLGSVWRLSNRCLTSARPQLWANLAAPQCDASASRCLGVGSSANRKACVTTAVLPPTMLENSVIGPTVEADPDSQSHVST